MKYKLINIMIIFGLVINYSCTTTKDYFEPRETVSETINYDHIYISITTETDGKFAVELDTGEERLSYTTGITLYEYKTFLEDLNEDISYYEGLDESQISQDEFDEYKQNLGGGLFQKKLLNFGRAFFNPIKDYIDQTSKIIFVINNDSLNLFPDLFIFKGQYLYLQKPIIYSFSKNYTVEPIYSDEWSILSASFRELDPKGTTLKVSKTFKKSTYRDGKDASDLSELLTSQNNYDVILFSCHGSLSEDTSKGLDFGKFKYGPEHFKNSSSKITFFDACYVGVSKQFIDVMTENGTKIYISAIIASEVGESSDILETDFFKNLKNGFSPSTALYKTKIKLAKHFNNEEDYLRLSSSFLYRVYYL